MTERDTCLACVSEVLSLPVKSNLAYIPNNTTMFFFFFFEMCIRLRYYVRVYKKCFLQFYNSMSPSPSPNLSPFSQNQLSQQTLPLPNIITLSVTDLNFLSTSVQKVKNFWLPAFLSALYQVCSRAHLLSFQKTSSAQIQIIKILETVLCGYPILRIFFLRWCVI